MSYFKAAGLMLLIHLAFAGLGWWIAGRDGALVALDMVQIGGRNAEIARHGRLGQGEIAPQPLETAAEEQLAVSGSVHGCS